MHYGPTMKVMIDMVWIKIAVIYAILDYQLVWVYVVHMGYQKQLKKYVAAEIRCDATEIGFTHIETGCGCIEVENSCISIGSGCISIGSGCISSGCISIGSGCIEILCDG